jgi:High potential iron-sulfur protein
MVNGARRRLVRLALGGAAAAVAAVSAAFAKDKMSKQEAEYQDSPKDIRMCATCTLFEPPGSCKVVDGDVSPDGWCKAFALAD